MATTCMGAHHVVGLPTSLGRMMAPMSVFLSRPFLVSFSQWTATDLCLRMGKGLALGSTNSWRDQPFMVGSFCLSQQLKADLV